MGHSCSAADDIPRADELRALVKDLWDMRLAKLRKSVDLMVTQQKTYAKVSVSYWDCDALHYISVQ